MCLVEWHFIVVPFRPIAQLDDIHYPLGQPVLRHGDSLSEDEIAISKQAARACILPPYLAEVTHAGWWHPVSMMMMSAIHRASLCLEMGTPCAFFLAYEQFVQGWNSYSSCPQWEPSTMHCPDMLYLTLMIVPLQMSNVLEPARTSESGRLPLTATGWNNLTSMGHNSLILLWHHTTPWHVREAIVVITSLHKPSTKRQRLILGPWALIHAPWQTGEMCVKSRGIVYSSVFEHQFSNQPGNLFSVLS